LVLSRGRGRRIHQRGRRILHHCWRRILNLDRRGGGDLGLCRLPGIRRCRFRHGCFRGWGFGGWGFDLHGSHFNLESVEFWFTGNFGDAKKAAVEAARRLGYYDVTILT
jgi:hypothetical protein